MVKLEERKPHPVTEMILIQIWLKNLNASSLQKSNTTEKHKALLEVTQPLEWPIGRIPDPSIAEVEDAKERLAGLRDN